MVCNGTLKDRSLTGPQPPTTSIIPCTPCKPCRLEYFNLRSHVSVSISETSLWQKVAEIHKGRSLDQGRLGLLCQCWPSTLSIAFVLSSKETSSPATRLIFILHNWNPINFFPVHTCVRACLVLRQYKSENMTLIINSTYCR